jgi:DNA-binding transcriptional LysR family regulator
LIGRGDESALELRQLELFVAVAEEKHFTRAARRSHIGQSALSTTIRALERDLDTLLFLRTTRSVELTEAGRALLVAARRTLAAAETARQSVHDSSLLVGGLVSLGAIAAPGLADLPHLLVQFRRDHPTAEVRYVRDTSMALLEMVRVAATDIAFVTMPRQLPLGVVAQPLVEERLMLICRPDHPLAGRKTVSMRSLATETFVGAPPGSLAHDVLDRVSVAAGARPHAPFEVNDPPTTLEFVAQGLGVTVLQQSFASVRPDLSFVPLSDRDATWTLAVATAQGRQLPKAAEILLDIVVSSLLRL